VRTLVIVPTHNEASNITELLEKVRAVVPDADVMVIDDVSTDGTRDLVRQAADRWGQITLVERDRKAGLGDAYRHGFRLGLAEGYEVLVEIDADHSHDPAMLPMMLGLSGHGVGLVIGSRYIPGGSVAGWTAYRTWLSRWGNRYAAIMLGLAINDATAGYRAYSATVLKRIDLDAIRADGYGFQIEMTYRAIRAGASIVEVPILFRDRVAGASKMHRRIVVEAFGLVTLWGLRDLLTLRRRRRAYRIAAPVVPPT
jgi:dolichol-phosphate mannosyltransferase